MFRLLVFDVEGTLFRPVRLPGTSIGSSIWQGIATALGPDAEKEEIESHQLWEKGFFKSYLEWMEATVSIHRKYHLTSQIFQSIVRQTEYNENVADTLKKLNRRLFVPVLVSGGFRELTARAQRDFDIRHAFAACEYLFGEDGNLESFNLLPCDFEGKIDFIKLMLRELRCGDKDWIFVGDDRNDVPIAKAAPVSVAYRAVPELKAVATHSIEDFAQLLDILHC